ncbi:hypothetical protein QE405_002481 [Nocardioides zeae]|uniref:Uncharacterized protein n=2 Tax=Nocardioides zeae TaxID=1457234 RepID=A0AAJ1U6U6_9ACTN|nr:hypothetical protein [Nocardioides zeae]
MCLNDGSLLWSMAVQYADGSVRTIEGDNGFCRDVVVGDTVYVGAGPEVYGAFIAALAEQRAVGTPPADLVASPPACERDPDDPFGPTAVMPATPPLGDLLVEPRLCWQDADRSWHGTPLSVDDVAVVDADIAARLSDREDVDAPFGDGCPPWREAAIAGVSRWGEPVWIGGSCATFQWSDGRGGVYSWTPSPDVLERILELTGEGSP